MIQPIHVEFGQAKTCRVHDIILDYIKRKAVEENFVTSLDAAVHGRTSEYKVRRLCVSNCNEENVTLPEGPILSQVRSISIFSPPGMRIKISWLFFTALRVLDLSSCWYADRRLVENIEKLLHLRYLDLLPRSMDQLPDKIGQLQYLQTLDTRCTGISELPTSIINLKRLAHLYISRDTRFPDGVLGQMQSLEELDEYGINSPRSARRLQEISRLTKLRTLKTHCSFTGLEDPTMETECIDRDVATLLDRDVATLLSLCNLHNLHITSSSFYIDPLSLDSWHLATPCNLWQLRIRNRCIFMVPNWMGSLGNLGVLELAIMCVRPEDVEILGTIPSLLFLELETHGGSKDRITVLGSSGFRNLKYFSLRITYCGTALEFEAGSMRKLEHVKLHLMAHHMKCLNGFCDLGIQHLSALSKVELIMEGRSGGHVTTCIKNSVNNAVEKLPNRPTIRFEITYDRECKYFGEVVCQNCRRR